MERIKILREALSLNIADFSRQLDVPRSTLVGWEEGKSVSIGVLKSLEKKFNVNIDWFLTGEGEMFCQENVNSHLEKAFNDAVAAHPKFATIEARLTALEQRISLPAEEKTVLSGDFTADSEPEYDAEERVQVPYVHDIAAGPPIRQAEDQSQSVAAPARLVKKGNRYYAASIRGTSMTEAGIRDGDTVLVRHADMPKNGAVQVVRYKGKSTLKRLREVEGGWELHYEDGTGTVVPVDSGQYEVQGDFVAVLPDTAVPN